MTTDNSSIQAVELAAASVAAGMAMPAQRLSASARIASVLILLIVACAAVLAGWLPGRVPGGMTEAMPWLTDAAGRLGRGQLPLWNDQSGLGEPMLGGGRVAVFYPAILLHIVLPAAWAFTVAAALHLWLAGVGTWLLAGRGGLGGSARLLAGVTFMLCGPSVLAINGVQGNVIPWVPWAALVVEQLIERAGFWRLVVATLVFAVQFAGASASASAGLIVACLAIWLVRLLWAAPIGAMRAAPLLLVALLVGLTLAGVEWLPFVEYVRWRGVVSITGGTKGGHDAAMAFGFIGGIPLLLAGYALATQCRNRSVLRWSLVVLLSGIGALMLLASEPLAQRAPWVRLVRDPVLLVGMALGLAMLSAHGLESLMQGTWDAARVARWQTLLLRVALPAALLAIVGYRISGGIAGSPSLFSHAGVTLLWPPAVLLLAVLVNHWLSTSALPSLRGRAWLGLAVVNLLAFSIVQTWAPRTLAGDAAKDLAAATQPATTQPTTPAVATSQPTRLPGVLAAMPREWVARRTEMCASRPATLERLHQAQQERPFDPQEVVLVDKDVAPDIAESVRLPQWMYWWQRVGWSPQRGELTCRRPSPERIEVDLRNTGGAWLVIADAYWPGWRATADQQETLVFPAYGMVRTMPVFNPSTNVILEYRPRGFRYGVFTTAGGALALLLIVGLSLFGRDSLNKEGVLS